MDYRTKCKIRSALAIGMLVLVCVLLILAPIVGAAMAEEAAEPAEVQFAEMLTWEYLATVTGAAAIVMLIVQVSKGWLDKIWKIPTTLYAYVLAVVTMLVATAFTSGLTVSSALLTLFNGWIVAATAAKSYDVMAGK